MKLTLFRGAAAVALAAAALFAVPTAANAYGETPAPGETVALSVPSGIFAANESVSVLLSGEDANFARANQGIVRAAQVTNAPIGTVLSNAAGGVNFSITLPSTASGTYSALLTSASNPSGYTLTFSPSGATGGTGTGGTGTTGSSALPPTGLDSGSLLGLWVGGGALVLAGGAVAVAAAVCRQRINADA